MRLKELITELSHYTTNPEVVVRLNKGDSPISNVIIGAYWEQDKLFIVPTYHLLRYEKGTGI